MTDKEFDTALERIMKLVDASLVRAAMPGEKLPELLASAIQVYNVLWQMHRVEETDKSNKEQEDKDIRGGSLVIPSNRV